MDDFATFGAEETKTKHEKLGYFILGAAAAALVATGVVWMLRSKKSPSKIIRYIPGPEGRPFQSLPRKVWTPISNQEFEANPTWRDEFSFEPTWRNA